MPSTSRPNTPSTSRTSGRISSNTPPSSRANSFFSSPSKPLYPRSAKSGSDSLIPKESEDYDDQDEEGQYILNESMNEDEFGLPSISAARREGKRVPIGKVHDPGGAQGKNRNNTMDLGIGANGQEIANSSDIAEERGPLDYPAAKKSEGKILRPQYKDILRGKSHGF